LPQIQRESRKDEKNENEQAYPVRSLHNFLYELNKEWSKFRNGSVLSMVASGIILVFFVLRFLRDIRMGTLGFMDLLLIVLVTAFLVYGIYIMVAQYRFFSKWERRVGLLMYMKEKILSEKLKSST